MKTCSKCGVRKSRDDFGLEQAKPDGRKAYCRECAAEYAREHRRTKPDLYRTYEQRRLERHGEERRERDRTRWAAGRSATDRKSRRRFAAKVRAKYGISLEAYDRFVSAPCTVCGATEDIVLDHCHESGVIRGPLCRWCNLGLGHFTDDPERLRAAAAYLEQHA